MAGVAGLEPATPGFGVRYLPLLLVFLHPIMTVSVEFSQRLGVADTLQSRPVFGSWVAKMVAGVAERYLPVWIGGSSDF
jgi:hypothetical protein